MRLRTLIELLVALILTFAALFAVSKMARTTGIKVDNTYARMNTAAVCLKLNDAGSKSDRLGCAATNATRCAAGIDSPYSDA